MADIGKLAQTHMAPKLPDGLLAHAIHRDGILRAEDIAETNVSAEDWGGRTKKNHRARATEPETYRALPLRERPVAHFHEESGCPVE